MTHVVKKCRRTWRRLGVPRKVAEEMAVDLEADIAAAEAEGHPATSVIGADAEAFATAWATERGVVRPRLRLALTALAALVGALPGAGFALFVAAAGIRYGLSSEAMAGILSDDMTRVGENAYEPDLSLPPFLLLALCLLGAVFACAGAVGAVAAALHWRNDLVAARTVRSLAAALPAATAAAVGATILYSSTRAFSTDFAVVIADVMVAAGVFAASVALVRLHAVRRERARLIPRRA